MIMIEFLIVSLVFLTIGYYIGKGKAEKRADEITYKKVAPPPPMPNFTKVLSGNLKPSYYAYERGTYANVNKCSNDKCGLIGLYEDLHTARPCPNCGHRVVSYGAAKWDNSPEHDNALMWIKAID
jgi:hypothetical protein